MESTDFSPEEFRQAYEQTYNSQEWMRIWGIRARGAFVIVVALFISFILVRNAVVDLLWAIAMLVNLYCLFQHGRHMSMFRKASRAFIEMLSQAIETTPVQKLSAARQVYGFEEGVVSAYECWKEHEGEGAECPLCLRH